MNKQSVFCLVMAIFWTVIAAAAAYTVIAVGVISGWSVLVLAFAVVCTCLQWMRFKNSYQKKEKNRK